ncbi:hypothetical protein [Ferruginibacter sp.]
MGKAARTFVIFMGVWFISSLLNGFITGACIMINGGAWFADSEGAIFLAIIFSFICSVPFVGLVWFITMLAQAHGREGHDLFQLVLKLTLFFGSVGAIFFFNTFGHDLKTASWAGAVSIIISSVTGVMVFRQQLKTT